ncbi:L,D-transpeptidase [Streptomyces kanamyceticus]|uniref:Murein L,D-transpeptidase n=1 Tax=Streptomyces kanamyceticus TaxID=1967 RepID=A0A5J6GQ10_STRKN|nr:L,D-transpeptidase [Streptomyces kanamyceticus]QEU95116.1 murein L,D-transpeptidase [Streptomyces kanamyceticus]
MSDDLSAALHDLAADRRTPPPVPGAEIRCRAVLRRRRRRAAVAGGALVTAAVAVTVIVGLLPGSDDGPDRTPAPVATQGHRKVVATLDLDTHRMTVDGRTLPVSAGSAQHPTPTGRMTVTAVHREKRMPAGDTGLGGEYDLKLPWVVELRTPDGRTNYLVALTYDEKAPGVRDITRGWIGLRTDDARWLHDRLEPGDVITVRAG